MMFFTYRAHWGGNVWPLGVMRVRCPSEVCGTPRLWRELPSLSPPPPSLALGWAGVGAWVRASPPADVV